MRGGEGFLEYHAICLIKGADAMVGWLDRVAPKPVMNSLDLYTRWVGELGSQRNVAKSG